jgi:glycosyltransferase involved in cell wall biosynthesis
VSVVVPTRGRRESVGRLLRALCDQTLPPASFEVIVCVDGGDDGTRELVAGLQAPFRLQALWQPHSGRASACNTAIRAASGEVVVLLDDDMEPGGRCLAAHLAEHPAGSRRCVVGAAPIEARDADPLTGFMAKKFDAHLARLGRAGHEFGVRDFYSGNASIRRDVLNEVGPFDETFRTYGNEDLELAFRLRRSGVTISLSGEATARQHYEKPFGALAHDTVAKGRTAVKFAAMHPEVAPELQFASGLTGSRRWRLALRALLRLTSLAGRTPATLLRLTSLAERARWQRLDTVYHLLLEYFYWLGVCSAQQEGSPPAEIVSP